MKIDLKWFNRFRVFDRVDWTFFWILAFGLGLILVLTVHLFLLGSWGAWLLLALLLVDVAVVVKTINLVTNYRLTQED